MKLVNILFACMLTTSCSQNIDLENLRNDSNVSEIVKANKNLVRDQDVTYGLLSYRTIDLKNFNFGSVYFSKYEFPNGYDADYNDLFIHIDDYKNNNFLGFTIEIVNQEESKKLLEYLTNKYGKPESRYAGNHDKAFVWYNNKSNQWILVKQYDRITRNNESFVYTKCTVVKQGVQVENSKDPKFFTILDNFSLAHPKNK